jgi:hypothetical protein
MRLGAPLLLSDEGPQFVQLQPADADANEPAIVQLGAALADLKGKCLRQAEAEVFTSALSKTGHCGIQSGHSMELRPVPKIG